MGLQFDEIVGGIEDGISGVLDAKLLKSPEHPDRYLKEVAFYGGEIDEKTLRANLAELQGRTPLGLIAYGDGEDKLMPATAAVFGEPRTFRHECTFTLIAVSQDARGGTAQRRGAPGGVGVYRMVADFRRELSGLWFLKRENAIVAHAGDLKLQDGDELLTFDPLTVSKEPPSVEYLARLPEMTAYAVHFDTYFEWTEEDRRDDETTVTEIDFTFAATSRDRRPGQRPGVIIE